VRSHGSNRVTLLRLRRFRNAYGLRAAAVWAGLRVALAFGGVVNPALGVEVAMLPIVAVAVLLDARRRSEDLFLGNLGVPARSIVFVVIPVAALLEALVP